MKICRLNSKNADMDYHELIASAGLTEEAVQAIVRSTADQRSYANEHFCIVASSIHGLGAFARHPMAAQEAVGWARICGQRTPLGRYLNHADPPNAMFQRVGSDLLVMTVAPIGKRREIAIDYRQALAANWEAPVEWRR